jgi:L-amino acid N-acyltransferase YncA
VKRQKKDFPGIRPGQWSQIVWRFGQLGIHRIVTTVMEGNDASLHVLQKLGFTTVRIEKGPRTFHHLILHAPLQNK